MWSWLFAKDGGVMKIIVIGGKYTGTQWQQMDLDGDDKQRGSRWYPLGERCTSWTLCQIHMGKIKY